MSREELRLLPEVDERFRFQPSEVPDVPEGYMVPLQVRRSCTTRQSAKRCRSVRILCSRGLGSFLSLLIRQCPIEVSRAASDIDSIVEFYKTVPRLVYVGLFGNPCQFLTELKL